MLEWFGRIINRENEMNIEKGECRIRFGRDLNTENTQRKDGDGGDLHE
jgi:hypothetical protein